MRRCDRVRDTVYGYGQMTPSRTATAMTNILPGHYRHYKGNDYTVLGIARHSETLEELVIYRAEYGDRGLWVRPATMFAETVLVDGQNVPRFRRVEPSGSAPA